MSATAAELKRRHEEFSEKLVALVNQYLDVCAPSIDPIEEAPCDHGIEKTCDCGLPADTMLTEWSLLSQWIQMSGDDCSWSTAVHAPAMLRSHKIGLLTSHLQGL